MDGWKRRGTLQNSNYSITGRGYPLPVTPPIRWTASDIEYRPRTERVITDKKQNQWVVNGR